MKNNLSSKFLRSSKTILTGALLSLTVFVSYPGISPGLADSQQERIATLQDSEEKWIEINLATQRLTAWEGGKPVYAIIVSTGKPSTPTRLGNFQIREKRRLDRMRGPGYDVPNVPYAMYYHGGYAIHGAYWHHNFGTPVSHGCTNVAVDHAQWLFNWADIGTAIVIHEFNSTPTPAAASAEASASEPD